MPNAALTLATFCGLNLGPVGLLNKQAFGPRSCLHPKNTNTCSSVYSGVSDLAN